jgi:hypothetical protein
MTRLSSAATHSIALRLRVDGWTAEVVGAMRQAGIRPILLKGPVIARWLYAGDPAARTYCDCDLLVAPDETERARALLEQLGFTAQPHPTLAADEHHARIFVRESDGANVDLHRTLHGMEATDPRAVWAHACSHLVTMAVGGVTVEVPDTVLATLNVALHLAPGDGPRAKAWRDLERALATVDGDGWRAAVALSRELGIEHELAVRLRRLPEGARLADGLELSTEGSAYYSVLGSIDAGRAPRGLLTLTLLRSQRGHGARLRYAAAKLLPPAEQLRREHALARRGPAGLLAARVARVAVVLTRLPAALVAYRRELGRRA